MGPSDWIQILVAIIGAASVIFSAWLSRKERLRPEAERPSGRPSWPRIVTCIGLVLLVANLGVFGWRYWGSIAPEATTEVKISYPHDGSSVEMLEIIRGTSRRIPEGQVVWVVVFPHVTGCYYPQDYPADVQENGDWSSRAHIGVQGDVGLRFDIIVVVADKEAQNAFNAYLMEGRDKKTWPGLEGLPDGAVIYDRVTVTRM